MMDVVEEESIVLWADHDMLKYVFQQDDRGQ